MGQYIYIKNSNKKDPGLGISKNVLKIVGERCVAQTINALAIKEESKDQGVTVTIRNNTLKYKFNVAIKDKSKIEAFKDRLEKDLTSDFAEIFDELPFSSDYHFVEYK
jgi:hypothetical protein